MGEVVDVVKTVALAPVTVARGVYDGAQYAGEKVSGFLNPKDETEAERKKREATDPVLIAAREAKLKIEKDLQDQADKVMIETQKANAQSDITKQRKLRLGAAKSEYFAPSGAKLSNTSNQKTILGA